MKLGFRLLTLNSIVNKQNHTHLQQCNQLFLSRGIICYSYFYFTNNKNNMLYPNPSKGILHINGMLEENALLSVYDRLWKKVMETKIENDK